MAAPSIQVVTPSRLHFGLLSLGNTSGRQFGGVGLMVDRPGIRLTIDFAKNVEATGPHATRVLDFANRYIQGCGEESPGGCHLHVEDAPREHTGLGVGTQLALAVARGLESFYGHTRRPIVQLAIAMNRAKRSAVGMYGFDQGGLIFEEGRQNDEPVGQLTTRIELPGAWRFLLICQRQDQGVSGSGEATAFDQLPQPTTEELTGLYDEATQRLLPAAAAGDFAVFGESLYQYGTQAGALFSARHDSPFATPQIETLVSGLRQLGIAGAGQTSWGPTVFALVENDKAAVALVETLESQQISDGCDVTVAKPCDQGAQIVVSN